MICVGQTGSERASYEGIDAMHPIRFAGVRSVGRFVSCDMHCAPGFITSGSTVNDVLQQTEQLWRQYSGKVGLGMGVQCLLAADPTPLRKRDLVHARAIVIFF